MGSARGMGRLAKAKERDREREGGREHKSVQGEGKGSRKVAEEFKVNAAKQNFKRGQNAAA